MSLIRGVSITLSFVPLSVTTLGDLSAEQTGVATAIFNLMRNLGRASAFFAANLRDAGVANDAECPRRAFSTLNPAYEQYLGTLKAHLATHDGLLDAVNQTQLLAYNLLQQQAASLAYIDIFQLLTVISLACIPFVFLLRNVAIKNGSTAMH